MAEKIATRDAYGSALRELGKVNEKVVVFDADLSGSTKTSVFQKEFPDRHFNAGIAEMNMVGMAAGAATCGKIPFTSTFAIFGTGRVYDAIRNSICYPKLNVKLAMSHAGLTVGEDGASHQMIEDIALMSVLPNMTVFVPADAEETKQAIFAAAGLYGPVYIRLGRAKTDQIFDSSYQFKAGKAAVVKDGTDVTLAACGIMVAKAIEASEALAGDGISAAVVNFSTIKPFDKETLLTYAQKTGAVVTCEEHSIFGGLNSAVCRVLSADFPRKVGAVAVKDTFGESGKPDELLRKYGLTAQEIIRQVKSLLK